MKKTDQPPSKPCFFLKPRISFFALIFFINNLTLDKNRLLSDASINIHIYRHAGFVPKEISIFQKWRPEVWNHEKFLKGGCHDD